MSIAVRTEKDNWFGSRNVKYIEHEITAAVTFNRLAQATMAELVRGIEEEGRAVRSNHFEAACQAQDEFSLISQQRTAAAQQEGRLSREIVAIEVTKAIKNREYKEKASIPRSFQPNDA